MVSESGINKIVVEYLENSNYNSELAQLVFNVDKINTTIKIDQINTTLYETAILKAYVEDIYGKTVNTGKVVFKVDDLVIGSANVEDGIAILTYMPTWNRILTKNVMVSYMENDKYCESSNETEINLIKTKATMLLTHNDNLKVGQKLIMTVSLGDNLINTGKIIFKIDGKTLKDEDGQMIFVKVTNGIAQFEYTIQSIFSARTHKITAVYAGTVLYERTETSSMLDIMKVNTHIELTPFIATMGENATLSAKILDEYNKPVQRNTTIAIKINGKTCINTVVENGILNITLPTETFKNEYYTLTIICGENSVYNGNTYTTFLLNKLASNNTKTIKTADISNNIKPVVYKTYSNNNENSSNISLTDNKPLLNNTKQRI